MGPSFQPAHGLFHRTLDGGLLQPGPCDHIGNDFRIVRGVKDGAGKFQLPFDLSSIGDVSIVSHRQHSLDMAHHHRLRVGAGYTSGGGIPGVTYGHLSRPKFRQYFRCKDLRHKAQVLVAFDNTVCIDCDAAALLTTVLQGIKGIIGTDRHIGGHRRTDAKNPTLLMNRIKHN